MNKAIRLLISYFIKGALVMVPLILTIYVLYFSFIKLDSIVDFGFTGSGILVTFLTLSVIGFLVTTLITEPIFNYFDKLLNRMPLFKLLYSSVRDLLEAFVGEDKKFNEPVLVELSAGVKQIGFLTQKDLSSLGLANEVAVYFPFSYSIAGKVLLVDKKLVTPLPMKAAEAMKFAVSGGVSDL